METGSLTTNKSGRKQKTRKYQKQCSFSAEFYLIGVYLHLVSSLHNSYPPKILKLSQIVWTRELIPGCELQLQKTQVN